MEMESEDVKICGHFKELDKTKLLKSLSSWSVGASCYYCQTKFSARDTSARISLQTYLVGCSRTTKGQCLFKAYEKDSEMCLTLNPVDSAIWY